MQYKIVSANTCVDIEKVVNDLFRFGWSLSGNLTTDVDGYYYQTMVKYKE